MAYALPPSNAADLRFNGSAYSYPARDAVVLSWAGSDQGAKIEGYATVSMVIEAAANTSFSHAGQAQVAFGGSQLGYGAATISGITTLNFINSDRAPAINGAITAAFVLVAPTPFAANITSGATFDFTFHTDLSMVGAASVSGLAEKVVLSSAVFGGAAAIAWKGQYNADRGFDSRARSTSYWVPNTKAISVFVTGGAASIRFKAGGLQSAAASSPGSSLWSADGRSLSPSTATSVGATANSFVGTLLADGIGHLSGTSSSAFGVGYTTIDLLPVILYTEEMIYVRSHNSAIWVVT